MTEGELESFEHAGCASDDRRDDGDLSACLSVCVGPFVRGIAPVSHGAEAAAMVEAEAAVEEPEEAAEELEEAAEEAEEGGVDAEEAEGEGGAIFGAGVGGRGQEPNGASDYTL